MREQKIDFFQYSMNVGSQLLFLKSRYMTADQPGYDQQKSFDDALVKLGLLIFQNMGRPLMFFFSAERSGIYS